MPAKGTKQTPKGAAAGAANLAKYNPAVSEVTHGAWSRHIRKRYSDERTREGKQLAAIMGALVADFGGQESITAGQRLILDQIRAKLVVLLQISKWVDRQPSIVSPSGELLPCLGRNFTTYSESLRRDLEALAALAGKKGKVDLNEYLAGAYGKGAK